MMPINKIASEICLRYPLVDKVVQFVTWLRTVGLKDAQAMNKTVEMVLAEDLWVRFKMELSSTLLYVLEQIKGTQA